MSESDELGKLADLHQRGALNDAEFERAKARVLSGAAAAGSRSGAGDLIHSLRRSRSDHWLGGVCGGIGQVTDTPAWIWRLLFILLVLCAGTGILLYVLLWILLPVEPVPYRFDQPAQ